MQRIAATLGLDPLEAKSGAQAAATVSLDPLGGVSVAIDSVPQGQGHCTATAQIVADIFGLAPEAIRVEAAIDTGKDAWSIAAGNYSSRFAVPPPAPCILLRRGSKTGWPGSPRRS
jgi:CO/xanthine dehydrogenase Mo-binding subunit